MSEHLPDHHGTADERLSALETRVSSMESAEVKRKKSLRYILKEWGGVITLIIALLYSFPLGVWDRFVESPKQKNARQISALRKTLETTIDIYSQGIQAINTLQNPEGKEGFLRNLYTRMAMTLEQNKDALEKHKAALSFSELIVIASVYNDIGLYEKALEFCEIAQSKAGNDDLNVAEALRMKARCYAMRGKKGDINKFREAQKKALSSIKKTSTAMGKMRYVATIFDLALMERKHSNFKQSNSELETALKLYSNQNLFIHDNGILKNRMLMVRQENTSIINMLRIQRIQ